MRRRALLAGVLALGGCGLSERPYAEKREWPLSASRLSAAPPRANGRVLLVRDLQATPGLEARGLQTLQADGSVRTDFYEEWAVPPADGVGSSLRQWLGESGLFAAVVPPGSRLAANLVLEGTLAALVADAAKRTGRMTLALVLLDQREGATRILMQRRFTAERPLPPGADAPAIAAALRACLRDVIEQVEAAMGRYAGPAASGGGHRQLIRGG